MSLGRTTPVKRSKIVTTNYDLIQTLRKAPLVELGKPSWDAADELERLAHLERYLLRLEKYVIHDFGCPKQADRESVVCTCGLSDLLLKIKSMSKEQSSL